MDVPPSVNVYILSLEPPRTLSEPSTSTIALSNLPQRLVLALSALILLLAMCAAPSFLSRLLRPLSSSSKMGLNPEANAQVSIPDSAQKCTVAAGCFWGVEHLYRKHFGNGGGLLAAEVGYCGGDNSNPNYRQVCSGNTGHAEALQVTFDPDKVSYASLLEFFYRMHDPTTLNRQGMDSGTQYRSGIFYHSPEQKTVADDVTRKVQDQWYSGKPITTVITEAREWYSAEAYHQRYLDINPGGYECPAHHVRKFPALK